MIYTIIKKIKIIYHKLSNNWSSDVFSSKILDFQNKSKFIKFLRFELSKIKNSDSFENQIKKNVLRSIGKYSEDLIHLGFLIFEETSIKLYKTKKYIPSYFSIPYLMIHLPDDKSEEGTMHSDYEYTKDGFVTCWTPLEAYNFPALLTLGKLGQIISAFPRTNNLISFFKEKEISKKAIIGEVKFWSECFMHKGNRNSTKTSSFVMVTKLSKEPLQIGSYKISQEKLDKALYQKNIINLAEIDHEEIYQIAFDLIKQINEINNSKNYFSIISIIEKLKKQYNSNYIKIISFFLSVQAQRLWMRPNYFETLKDLRISNPYRLWIVLDLLSIILGFENTSSIQRLKGKSVKFIPYTLMQYAEKCVDSFEIEKTYLTLWNQFINKRKNSS